jgi:hypothetical protein
MAPRVRLTKARLASHDRAVNVATRDNLMRLAAIAAAALLILLTSFHLPVGAASRTGQAPRALPGASVEVHAGQTTQRLRPIRQTSPSFVATAAGGAASADIQVTYNGFSQAAQDAFEAAVTVWESQIVSPCIIRVNANWTPLGTNVLGSAGPTFLIPLSDSRYYAAALAESMSGACNTTTTEINANFNSNFSGWYLGTDGNPPSSKWDFYTVVLHEVGHGLGFFGSFQVNGAQGSWGWSGHATRYDDNEWSAASGGTKLTNTGTFANPSAQLKSELTDGGVYFGGPEVVAEYGARARLYAPNTWSPGSSNSHFDEMTFPTGTQHALMTPSLANGEVIHDPGPLTRALFRDIGWETVGDASDAEPPVVSQPSAVVISPQQVSQTAALRVSWPEATDESGVESYELQRRKGSGSWVNVSLDTPISTSADVNVTPGSAYTFRLRATDTNDNTSAWMTTPPATLSVVQENGSAVGLSGTWKASSLSGASAGKVRYAGGVGRVATLTFDGTSVGFVSTIAGGRGIAEIWLDGAFVQNVDLYGSPAVKKAVVWAPSEPLSAGTHTLEVRVTGTKNALSSKTRVDIDAFLVWP